MAATRESARVMLAVSPPVLVLSVVVLRVSLSVR